MIIWKMGEKDIELVGKCVDRALAMMPWAERMPLHMDLTATHANGCPLDFQKLLDAPAFDFAHDVTGICRHLDRDTGKLLNCFTPRCVLSPNDSGKNDE